MIAAVAQCSGTLLVLHSKGSQFEPDLMQMIFFVNFAAFKGVRGSNSI